MIERCCNVCLCERLTLFWVWQAAQIIQQETSAALLDRDEEGGGTCVDMPTLQILVEQNKRKGASAYLKVVSMGTRRAGLPNTFIIIPCFPLDASTRNRDRNIFKKPVWSCTPHTTPQQQLHRGGVRRKQQGMGQGGARLGGWYTTGTLGGLVHQGNLGGLVHHDNRCSASNEVGNSKSHV